MAGKGIFHLPRAPFEDRRQISVPVVEVPQCCGKEFQRFILAKGEDAINDVIGPRLVDGIQVPGFDRGPERANDDARRIGPQVERLPIEEGR
ncbi:hypothetical protein GCM10011494_24150 [Novosphingobium endophyticum]|uniref:Uncharacterized protein n=1 Tax=Novosphingobium endophyticum TaxID=1955250 RepID=A0A916TT23_9SPHN|nr:hypothetical protein GCM10011494_24150 [Novosphingobium endophyticum]